MKFWVKLFAFVGAIGTGLGLIAGIWWFAIAEPDAYRGLTVVGLSYALIIGTLFACSAIDEAKL